MSTEMFPRLLPIDIKFFGGESPSPTKLSATYSYMQSAFYVVESFLGNGVDFRVSDDSKRKFLFNVSNAIGTMGNVYKPINQLVSIDYIKREFGNNNDHTSLDIISDPFLQLNEEKVLTIKKPINIPVDFLVKSKMIFGCDATGEGVISLVLDNGTHLSSVNINDSTVTKVAGEYVQTNFQIRIQEGVHISHIEIIPMAIEGVYDGYKDLNLYTMYLSSEEDTFMTLSSTRPYNVAYAISNESPCYWKVAKPCTYAIQELCTTATCKYCIGNTYDIYTRAGGTEGTLIGEPVCGGEFAATTAVANRPTNINTGENISYLADTSLGTANVYTIQSPLLMFGYPCAIKYSPYAAHALSAGEILTKNDAVLYDSNSGGGALNPIKYNIILQSGGRPDILIVNDSNGELIPSNRKVVILGGTYDITSYMKDTMEMASLVKPRSISVYAD